MKLELPSAGTRGVELPRLLLPVVRAMMGSGHMLFRLGMKIQGRPLLRLTTTGARTGKPRTAVLGWFPPEDDSDSWIVVASNAGSARHPGWAYNLAKNPEGATADVGKGPVAVRAELITDPERQAVWKRIVEMAPGYGAYEEKTDREIPIFRLTPL